MKKLAIVSFLLSISFLSYSQEYKRIEKGLSQTIYFDSKDSVLRVDFLDSRGDLRDNAYGYAIVKYERDANGNITEQSYFHADGKPAIDDLGVSKWVMKYNERSQKIYQAEFGTDGKLLVSSGSIHHIVFEWKYDQNGKLTKIVTTEHF
jgi:hypothetical protein